MHDRSAQARCVRRLPLAGAAVLSGALLAGLPLPGASATAQVAPPNRSELVPPERRERRDGPTLTIDGDMERAPCVLDRPEYADIRLTLEGVEFAGLESVPGLSLADAYDQYVGRELPLSVLCDIRAEANAILRSAGYLATVEIPEQNLADGIADFRVIFGRLTALRVRGEAGPSERVAARYLEKLAGGEVFNAKQAERYLLLADDLPGLDVRLSLRPAAGGAPGDLVGEIAVVRRGALLDVNLQNFGSRAIGPFAGLVRGEFHDLTGLGDRTSITVFSTAEFDEQQTVRIGHDFAVGGEGLRLGTGLTLSRTSPDLGLAGLDIDSRTMLASVFASYPLLRTRRFSAFLEGGVDIVGQEVDANEIRLTEDRVRMVYARISGEWTDTDSIARVGGYTPFEPRLRAFYSAELRQGLDVFSASPDCRGNPLACLAGGAPPPSRIEADPTPLLLRYQAGAEYRPDPLVTFSLEARAQATGDALPAFEEFAGGSFSIGRGYDPGAILGDSGIGGAFELRYGSLAPQGPQALAWQPYVFTDVAFVWNEDPSRRPLNPDRLWSTGGGVRAAWGSMMQADVLLAVPLERPDLAPELGDVRLMFSLTARLFPWRY
ncbi:ShlB/FhaC/HecB family hemolysin secretion/activation protein [Erythrobacter sp. HL-111]|uniref:ShlB/FhaC/HecB family hemolysin secretion/activation protein n=1 Tax=Erythrobacter sp. HL-111 TaxID=1798193 RepID=UPI000B7DB8BA|nr:ShlB/FhaC/HecB family hemolysin secretion/activation protein [Erythrobacter sp. HL-111]